LHKLFRQNKT